MRSLWHLCFVIMVVAIDCVHMTDVSTELESLRKRLDMVDLRLASDILILRRDLDTERRLRIELQNTVHQLQEQMFTKNHTKSPEETDILRANLKTQQSIIEQLLNDARNANYQNQNLRNGNNYERHNIIVLKKAFGEEKQWRKQTEKRVSDLRSTQEDLQSDLRTASDKVNELINFKSSTEKSLTSLRSELYHMEKKQNELNSSASNVINQMDAYIDGVSNQFCQLNPSYVNVCESHGMNKSSCCLRRVLQSVQETLKVNDLKLSEFEKQVNRRVSFSARISPEIKNIPPWDTIVFSDVIHNEGSAYDHTNGKFVAPVSGTYVFFSHILGASRRLETALKINEDIKLWLYSADPRHLAPGSNMLVIRMYKGDSARMIKHGPWGDQPFYIHNLWSTFSGFLLSAD